MKEIKKVLCLGLILILFLHTNYLVVYYSLYQLNTEKLTQSCCEKKVANCNAHCYLEKKMNEDNDISKKGSSAEIKLKLSEYVVKDSDSDLHSKKINTFYSLNSIFPAKEFHSDIEHPPRFFHL